MISVIDSCKKYIYIYIVGSNSHFCRTILPELASSYYYEEKKIFLKIIILHIMQIGISLLQEMKKWSGKWYTSYLS